MALYSSFAVLGAGSLGSFVTTELLKKSASVKILTRDDTKPELVAFEQIGANIVKVDYSDEETLKKALSDVQVVTIAPFGLRAQIDIAKVAKAAGVQLFVPAEYGADFNGGPAIIKKVVQDALTELDLPYALFFCGFFADIFHVMCNYKYAEGLIDVVGKGETPFSVTSRQDIARFVAHVLTTAQPSDLAWTKFHFEGDRLSLQDVAARAAKKLSIPVEIRHLDYDEAKKSSHTDFGAFRGTTIEDGHAVSGSPEQVKATTDKFFPDWNPAKFDAFIPI